MLSQRGRVIREGTGRFHLLRVSILRRHDRQTILVPVTEAVRGGKTGIGSNANNWRQRGKRPCGHPQSSIFSFIIPVCSSMFCRRPLWVMPKYKLFMFCDFYNLYHRRCRHELALCINTEVWLPVPKAHIGPYKSHCK